MKYPENDQLRFIDSDSSCPGLSVSFRKKRLGPEMDLIESFLNSLPLLIPKRCQATVFREPRLESGFPDLVIVVWREDVTLDWGPERESLEIGDLRIMHFLYQTRNVRADTLLEMFGQRAQSSIQRLKSAGMVRQVGASWAPCALHRSFATSKIIAIEAKVGKWEKVVNQALLNTWFASKSYVLVPNAPPRKKIDAAKKLGIGVCYLENQKVKEVPGDSNRLPRSYASWVLNDWAWRFSQDGKGVYA